MFRSPATNRQTNKPADAEAKLVSAGDRSGTDLNSSGNDLPSPKTMVANEVFGNQEYILEKVPCLPVPSAFFLVCQI